MVFKGSFQRILLVWGDPILGVAAQVGLEQIDPWLLKITLRVSGEFSDRLVLVGAVGGGLVRTRVCFVFVSWLHRF